MSVTEDYLKDFPRDTEGQIDALHEILEKSSSKTQNAIAQDLGVFSAMQRVHLYWLLIIVLACLALASIIAALVSTSTDLTPFFTFAGVAVGGITGLFIKSPTSQ